MSTVAIEYDYPRVMSVAISEDSIAASLSNGRTVSIPLAWSWRLSEATPAQRAHYELIGSGQGVHWPEVDEDISVAGMPHGTPAARPKQLTTA